MGRRKVDGKARGQSNVVGWKVGLGMDAGGGVDIVTMELRVNLDGRSGSESGSREGNEEGSANAAGAAIPWAEAVSRWPARSL